jgi:hypothetical protein
MSGSSQEQAMLPPATSASETARTSASVRGWWILVLLLLLEAGLYGQHALRDVVSGHPLGYDQSAYLTKSYRIYDSFRTDGLGTGLRKAFKEPAPTGMLQPILAALLYLVVGPSRLGALTLNFLAFALFQVVLVATLRWRTGRWSVGFLGVGLLLTAVAVDQPCGGLMDFRIDCLACCLFGVLICLILRSRVFLERPWTLAAGAVGGVLVLFRFFTSVYLAGIAFLFVSWCAGRWLRHASGSPERQRARKRLVGVATAGLLAIAVALPAMIAQSRHLWSYYIVNCFLGGDKEIRAREFGVEHWTDALAFYPRTICNNHTGRVCLGMGGGLVLLAIVMGRWMSPRAQLDSALREEQRASWVVLLLALLVPLFILNLSASKSPIVGSIALPPLLGLALLPLVHLAVRNRENSSRLAARLLGALAVFLVAAGVVVQASWMAHSFGPYVRDDEEEAIEMSEALYRASRELGLTSPLVATDIVADYLIPDTFNAIAYEHHGQLLKVRPGFTCGIFGISETDALASIRASDFVIVTVAEHAGASAYPFHEAMDGMRPRLRAVCEQEFVYLGRYTIAGNPHLLYARPALRPRSRYPDWLSREGLTLDGRTDVLRRFPVIQLTGRCEPQLLRNAPGVRAVLENGEEVPARMEYRGNQYQLRVQVDPAALPADNRVSLRLSFDRWFVPRDIGVGTDTRELVVWKPQEVRLLPCP